MLYALIRSHMCACAGQLRGSTDFVLTSTLPRILLNDTLTMPIELCMAPVHHSPHMLKKALKYLEADQNVTRVHEYKGAFYIMRFKADYPKLTKRMVRDYILTLAGDVPRNDKAFLDGTSGKECLIALIDICQAMHCVLTRKPDMVIEGDFPACKLNPAHLTCTCKGFRMRALCAHVIVITALYITDAMCIGDATSYDKTYLELLCEKLSTTKPASHRPKNTVGGAHIQPHGDSDEQSENGSSGDDEDLDEF